MGRWIGPIILAIFGLCGFAMTNSPDDVVSNASKWWILFSHHVPPWLASPEADTWIRVASGAAIAAAAGLLLSFRYGHQLSVPTLRHDLYVLTAAARRLWLKVEPWHIIAIGLAIAAVGIIWQQTRASLTQKSSAAPLHRIVELENSLVARTEELRNAKQEIETLKRKPVTAALEPMQSTPPAAPIVTELENAKQQARAAEDGRKAAIQSIKTDKERLDAALYEVFDAITKEAMPNYADAGYLTDNWHMKLISPDGRRAVVSEIDRIRPEYVGFINHISRILFKDYNYYMSSIQEVLQGGRMDLHGNLDKLKATIEALPEASTLQTVRLIEPQLNDFKKLVQAEAVWASQTRDRIRQKRNELAQGK
jgi:hypothetical protein